MKIKFDKDQKGLRRGFYICSRKCWEEGVRKKRRIKISSRENRFVMLPEIEFEEIIRR